jgi:nitrile hydratase accessory protein
MSANQHERLAACRRVEALLQGSPEGHAETSFDHPWEIRAFALAVAVHENGEYVWREFQSALVESISHWQRTQGADGDQPWRYYEHWLAALENVLAEKGLIAAAELDARAAEVLATPPDRHDQHAQPDPVAIDRGR